MVSCESAGASRLKLAWLIRATYKVGLYGVQSVVNASQRWVSEQDGPGSACDHRPALPAL